MVQQQWELAELLDFALWLDRPIFARMSRQKLKQYYDDAVGYGRRLAHKYPMDAKSMLSDMLALGINEVIDFTPEEKESATDRAYYNPVTRTVHWNSSFAVNLLTQRNACVLLSSEEEINRMILLHETFHHIEEMMEEPADIMLRKQYAHSISPIFREIAAFAFTNAQGGKVPCQLVDLLWLQVFAEDKYKKICQKVRMGGWEF